jgi:hypothetical protein
VEVTLRAPAKQPIGTTRSRARDEGTWEGVDEGLFEELRALRRQIADERSVPPFVVLSDAVLRDMARSRPATIEALAGIRGIGEQKLADLGTRLVNAITMYCREHGLQVGAGQRMLPTRSDNRISPSSQNRRTNPERQAAKTAPLTEPLSIVMVHLESDERMPGQTSEVGEAVRSVLKALPERSLSATMLAHVLRGSRGPKTQSIIEDHDIDVAGSFESTPFLELRNEILEVAGADARFALSRREQPDQWDGLKVAAASPV